MYVKPFPIGCAALTATSSAGWGSLLLSWSVCLPRWSQSMKPVMLFTVVVTRLSVCFGGGTPYKPIPSFHPPEITLNTHTVRQIFIAFAQRHLIATEHHIIFGWFYQNNYLMQHHHKQHFLFQEYPHSCIYVSQITMKCPQLRCLHYDKNSCPPPPLPGKLRLNR